ncbi:MAG: TIGR03905 family TSCPD domain-containing protein [Anaerovoracaceae bacterium]
MRYNLNPKGVCSREIEFDLNDGIVSNVVFHGGCNGNLKAISKLVDGMTVEEMAEKIEGIKCGHKSTSCGDQLVKLIKSVEG